MKRGHFKINKKESIAYEVFYLFRLDFNYDAMNQF